ncbi:MAG: SCO family protein [Verrucomicrobiales bacterium]
MKLFSIFSLVCSLAMSGATAELSPVKTNLPSCCQNKPLPKGKVSDQSLFNLDSKWTTDAAKEVEISALGGRPQVVTMFFATCIYACPILAHDMKKIQAALPEDVRAKVGFTLITFDSERDTVEALAAFRKRHQLPENWNLLRGNTDDVLELAALLGVKFKKEANGQYAHSNLISVLNGNGEIVFQKVGLNVDPAETAKAAQDALSFCLEP